MYYKKEISVWPCHGQGGTQLWMLTYNGEIRRDDTCLDSTGTSVRNMRCHGAKGNQYWSYDAANKQVKHQSSRKGSSHISDNIFSSSLIIIT